MMLAPPPFRAAHGRAVKAGQGAPSQLLTWSGRWAARRIQQKS
jgi:hypothetical protein